MQKSQPEMGTCQMFRLNFLRPSCSWSRRIPTQANPIEFAVVVVVVVVAAATSMMMMMMIMMMMTTTTIIPSILSF